MQQKWALAVWSVNKVLRAVVVLGEGPDVVQWRLPVRVLVGGFEFCRFWTFVQIRQNLNMIRYRLSWCIGRFRNTDAWIETILSVCEVYLC